MDPLSEKTWNVATIKVMANLQLNLPVDLQAAAALRARRSGYASVDAYVEDLLRADTTEGTDPIQEKLLLKRLSAPDAGEMTSQSFDAIRDRVRKVAANQE